MQRKLVVFDYCDTLVDIQSADAFIDYIRGRNNKTFMNALEVVRVLMVRIKLISLANRLFKGLNLNKRLKLFQLFGFRQEDIKKYAEEYHLDVLSKKVIEPLHGIFKDHVLNDRVVIISGGYSLYLHEYFSGFNVDVLGTEIKFYRGICLGVIDGQDCLSEGKVTRLMNCGYFKEFIDITYSDSITDKPLFDISRKSVVVSNKVPQGWASKNGYDEIVF